MAYDKGFMDPGLKDDVVLFAFFRRGRGCSGLLRFVIEATELNSYGVDY